MAPRRTPIEDRLRAKLAREAGSDCVVWTGRVSFNGYGRIGAGGRNAREVRVHRVAYELAHGPIPAGLQIDHLCRNRRCCNPDHLEVVTPRENTMRGNGPTAINSRKASCKRGHEFTPDNTFAAADGSRECRACRRAHGREYKRAQAAAFQGEPA